jgi:pimeloyl-ACP methyl ester carboxylesterase
MKNTQLIILLVIHATVMISCETDQRHSKTNLNQSADSSAHKNTNLTDSGYASVNGLNMYYETYGSGKPLVLLHGSYFTIPLNWEHIIPLLATDRQVIALEMQGHGRTKDINRAFSYEAMADDVSLLLKHLKIDSADILGYSMGGGVAFQFAVRHPEQLRRLVVISAPYKHNGWWPETQAAFATFNADMFKGSIIEKEYTKHGNDPARFPDFVKKVISIDLKPYDWTNDVKAIKAPLFLAIGDADGVRYEHALELYKAKGGGKQGDMTGAPASRLAILPGTTHIGMFFQRESWLVPMIKDFLDSDLKAKPPTFEK